MKTTRNVTDRVNKEAHAIAQLRSDFFSGMNARQAHRIPQHLMAKGRGGEGGTSTRLRFGDAFGLPLLSTTPLYAEPGLEYDRARVLSLSLSLYIYIHIHTHQTQPTSATQSTHDNTWTYPESQGQRKRAPMPHSGGHRKPRKKSSFTREIVSCFSGGRALLMSTVPVASTSSSLAISSTSLLFSGLLPASCGHQHSTSGLPLRPGGSEKLAKV